MSWCSANNALFLCLNCAGKHRGLGVLKSFVKSVSLDSWSNAEVEVMRRGGNDRMRKFLQEYQIKEEFPSNMKFSFLASYYYKEMVMTG